MNFWQLLTSGVTSGMVYGLVALGYHIVFRATGIIDFAQGEKAALGGLVALSILTVIGDHFWVALVIVLIVGFGFGWLYERFILRLTYARPPTVQVIVTVGVSQFIYFADGLIWGNAARPFPYSLSGNQNAVLLIGSVRLSVDRLWVWGLVLVVMAAFYMFFERSRRGQAMVAAADNPLGARLSGIDVAAMRSLAVSVATALSMLGGAVIAPFTLTGGAIGLPIAVKAFGGAMLGGLTTPYGVVIGSIIVGITESLAAGYLSYGFRDPVAFSVLLLVLLLRPQGIFGVVRARAG
jgi:branched-chain amino acid transport system permease protein